MMRSSLENPRRIGRLYHPCDGRPGRETERMAIAAGARRGDARRLRTGQFTSGVNLVEVYASVTDARGEP